MRTMIYNSPALGAQEEDEDAEVKLTRHNPLFQIGLTLLSCFFLPPKPQTQPCILPSQQLSMIPLLKR